MPRTLFLLGASLLMLSVGRSPSARAEPTGSAPAAKASAATPGALVADLASRTEGSSPGAASRAPIEARGEGADLREYIQSFHRRVHSFWARGFIAENERRRRGGAKPTVGGVTLKAQVEVVLDIRGHVLRSSVVDSSGDSGFDQTASELFVASAPFPAPTIGIRGDDGQLWMRVWLQADPVHPCEPEQMARVEHPVSAPLAVRTLIGERRLGDAARRLREGRLAGTTRSEDLRLLILAIAGEAIDNFGDVRVQSAGLELFAQLLRAFPGGAASMQRTAVRIAKARLAGLVRRAPAVAAPPRSGGERALRLAAVKLWLAAVPRSAALVSELGPLGQADPIIEVVLLAHLVALARPVPESAMARLLELSRSSDNDVRTEALRGRLGQAGDASPRLIAVTLAKASADVRSLGLRSLARPPLSKRNLWHLSDGVKDSSPIVRVSATWALGRVPISEEVRFLLRRVARDRNPLVRQAARSAQVQHGLAKPHADDAISTALAALANAVPEERARAAAALAMWAPQPR